MKIFKTTANSKDVYVNVNAIIYFTEDGRGKTIIYFNNGKDQAATDTLTVDLKPDELLRLIEKLD